MKQENNIKCLIPAQDDDNRFNEDKDIFYDIAIIGGGSGGISLALEAKKVGLNPIIFDHVDRSNQDYHWGLGGTCVNVGCIPKKLMHISAQIKETIVDSLGYGWNQQEEKEVLKKFSWKNLVYNIRKYILDNNVYYEMKLHTENIRYVNAFATLHDQNTVVFSGDKKNVLEYLQKINQKSIQNQEEQQIQKDLNLKSIKSKYIVLCTGGRPNTDLKTCPELKRYAMTSDDFFFNQKTPGKTLVIGGGYIALETAGILSSLGNPVTLATKSKYLRNFDQQMVSCIVDDLKQYNKVQMIPKSLPISVKEIQNKKQKKFEIQLQNQETNEIYKDTFDSVVMAIGRIANTQYLNLDRLGIKYNPNSGNIIGNFNGEAEQTSVSNIYALGDILEESPELTPVAQKAGKFLAKRLFYKNMTDHFKMDTQKEQNKYRINYNNCPTTIFTPSEYSCIGLSEEQAKQNIGDKNIVIYHSKYIPLDQSLSEKVNLESFEILKKKAYIKLICDKSQDEKIVGMHYLGPNAGEVMQGFSVLMNFAQQVEQQQQQIQQDNINKDQVIDQNSLKQRIINFLQDSDQNNNDKQQEKQEKIIFNKQFLDSNIGIHPTLAEEFLNLNKKSFEKPDQESC